MDWAVYTKAEVEDLLNAEREQCARLCEETNPELAKEIRERMS